MIETREGDARHGGRERTQARTHTGYARTRGGRIDGRFERRRGRGRPPSPSSLARRRQPNPAHSMMMKPFRFSACMHYIAAQCLPARVDRIRPNTPGRCLPIHPLGSRRGQPTRPRTIRTHLDFLHACMHYVAAATSFQHRARSVDRVPVDANRAAHTSTQTT